MRFHEAKHLIPCFGIDFAAGNVSDMANVGAWPIDPETETGLFRTELGDVVGTVHTDDAARADFQFIGDDGIAALIRAYPSSRDMAMSKAMVAMANQMIVAAQDIQVDDIKIKTVERARLMLEMAQGLAASAASADAASAFSVVPLAMGTGYFPRVPQGTPRPYGESGY